jgi:hypothetical protein
VRACLLVVFYGSCGFADDKAGDRAEISRTNHRDWLRVACHTDQICTVRPYGILPPGLNDRKRKLRFWRKFAATLAQNPQIRPEQREIDPQWVENMPPNQV